MAQVILSKRIDTHLAALSSKRTLNFAVAAAPTFARPRAPSPQPTAQKYIAAASPARDELWRRCLAAHQPRRVDRTLDRFSHDPDNSIPPRQKPFARIRAPNVFCRLRRHSHQ